MFISREFRLLPSRYNAVQHPKRRIVLHFTAGTTANGAFQWFSRGGVPKVATPYIVDVNGTVYEIFDPQCWGYSLGLPWAKAHRDEVERSTIAIEIVNPGPLKLDGDQLNWWPKQFKARYCSVADKSLYVKTKKWRDVSYWAAYPDPQMDAVAELCESLCKRFGIPAVLPPRDLLMDADPERFAMFKGICAHQNFRADKTDIGPAFDWSKLKAEHER